MVELLLACVAAVVSGAVALHLTAPVRPSPLKHYVDLVALVLCVAGAIGLVVVAVGAFLRAVR